MTGSAGAGAGAGAGLSMATLATATALRTCRFARRGLLGLCLGDRNCLVHFDLARMPSVVGVAPIPEDEDKG
jgi:hypothetical protein